VEDNHGEIEDYMHRYGYDRKEAEAAYHLNQARIRFGEMYVDEAEARGAVDEAFGLPGFPRIYAQMFLMSSVIPHFDALQNLLARNVLARQYPEGWGRRP
jgi:hypothetical protein